MIFWYMKTDIIFYQLIYDSKFKGSKDHTLNFYEFLNYQYRFCANNNSEYLDPLWGGDLELIAAEEIFQIEIFTVFITRRESILKILPVRRPHIHNKMNEKVVLLFEGSHFNLLQDNDIRCEILRARRLNIILSVLGKEQTTNYSDEIISQIYHLLAVAFQGSILSLANPSGNMNASIISEQQQIVDEMKTSLDIPMNVVEINKEKEQFVTISTDEHNEKILLPLRRKAGRKIKDKDNEYNRIQRERYAKRKLDKPCVIRRPGRKVKNADNALNKLRRQQYAETKAKIAETVVNYNIDDFNC